MNGLLLRVLILPLIVLDPVRSNHRACAIRTALAMNEHGAIASVFSNIINFAPLPAVECHAAHRYAHVTHARCLNYCCFMLKRVIGPVAFWSEVDNCADPALLSSLKPSW